MTEKHGGSVPSRAQVWAKLERQNRACREGHRVVHTAQSVLYGRGENGKNQMSDGSPSAWAWRSGSAFQVAEILKVSEHYGSMEKAVLLDDRGGERVSQELRPVRRGWKSRRRNVFKCFLFSCHSFHTCLDNGSEWLHVYCGLFHEVVLGCCCRTTWPCWEQPAN